MDKRGIEKFEIEREYCESKGIDWGIVTYYIPFNDVRR